MRLLLDEMYPARLAELLRKDGIDTATVSELALAGRSDPEVFAAAVTGGYAVLTENVGDFARLAADHIGAGRHQSGVLVALSSRFSRRPSGHAALVAAVLAVAAEPIGDRVVFLR